MKKGIYLTLFCVISCFVAGAQVGIGTSNPSNSAVLELKSNTKGLIFPRTSTSSRLAMAGVKGLMMYDTTLSQIFFHNGSVWIQVTSGLNHWSLSGNHLFNANTGNIGLGTTSPLEKLHLTGNVLLNGTNPKVILGGASDKAQLSYELTSNSTDFNITQFANTLFLSRTTGLFGFVNDLVVYSNGYVGIGTSVPETRLNVLNGTDVGSASGGFLQLGSDNEINVAFDNNEIQARNNGAVAKLTINNGGGAVQIGTATVPAGYTFGVNGRVICEELKIMDSVNWPDYVFRDDYPLRGIDELRRYIHLHKHLPNIPSADTVEKDGFLIGDMQKRMLEKIEELTLYVLLLEEKTSKLMAEVEVLKNKN